MRFQTLPNAGVLIGGKFDGHIFDVQLITIGANSLPNSLYKLTCEGTEYWYHQDGQDDQGRWKYTPAEITPMNAQAPMERGTE